MHKGVCQACARTGHTAAKPNFYAQETPRTSAMIRDHIVGDESSVRSTLRRENRQSAHRTRHMKSRCLYEPYRMPHGLRKNRESDYGRF